MIFDLDGTLLNTIGDLAAAANHTLAEMGFAPHTEEEYKYMVGNGIPKLIERFLPPGHRDKATQAQAARLFFPYYDAHKEDATAPYPGIPALLAALHGAGVKLGVVSNKEDALTKSVVSHYFPGLFDAVAGHTLGTPTKPDPHLVNGMRAAFGLSAQQRDNGLLFISLCALPQNAQNAAGICDNGARFPRLSDKARWCPTSRRIYHFRCAAGDECNGTLHYKAASAAADQPFFIL